MGLFVLIDNTPFETLLQLYIDGIPAKVTDNISKDVKPQQQDGILVDLDKRIPAMLCHTKALDTIMANWIITDKNRITLHTPKKEILEKIELTKGCYVIKYAVIVDGQILNEQVRNKLNVIE